MKFTKTKVDGAYTIDVDRIGDERGYFGRLWCQREMIDQGLKANICQSNIGVSAKAGTLRGLHYQTPPYQEVKILRCTRGAVFDVVLDLRKDSPTYKQWHGVELTQDNATMLYVPEGCATGFYTLTDDAEINYHATEFYQPAAATGVRWNDSAFNIQWPGEPTIMSDNDMNWPDYTD